MKERDWVFRGIFQADMRRKFALNSKFLYFQEGHLRIAFWIDVTKLDLLEKEENRPIS
jgi:hypothetical protein